jgi:hypothetical protein
MRTLMGLVLALAIAAPAVAQGEAPLTWVAYTRVKPGKTQEWLKLELENAKPILDKLVADGTVMTWGYAVRANHRPGYEWNVLNWVTTANWAGVGKWLGAALAQMQARSPEETKALEERYEALEEAGTHFDEVVRNAMISVGETPTRFNFIYTGHFRAKPGRFDAATQAFKENIVPIGDELRADGTLTGYGLHVQELHNQHQPHEKPWSHRTWYTFADLASLDKLQAAFAAGVTPERAKQRAETFEFKAHKDDLFVVLHHAPAPAAE